LRLIRHADKSSVSQVISQADRESRAVSQA
jgi:hypothetical protein